MSNVTKAAIFILSVCVLYGFVIFLLGMLISAAILLVLALAGALPVGIFSGVVAANRWPT